MVAARSELITRCAVSFVFGLITHSSLCLVPLFFSAASFLLQLSISAVAILIVIRLGSRCRKLIGFSASAPAFVFFNVLFVWCVYLFVARQANSRTMDIVFNGEVVILLVGLCRIISSNPGLLADRSPDPEDLVPSTVLGVESHDERVRYCKVCKAYIKGFDHHCPAFGNCIGQNNYVLFMVLLVGFLITEATYVVCSSRVDRRFELSDRARLKTSLAGILANSTMFFTLFQVLWQIPFLTWHLYCVCFNIRTDEWINWKKYPEFQHSVQRQPGDSFSRIEFRNPYDKGMLQNVMVFLSSKG